MVAAVRVAAIILADAAQTGITAAVHAVTTDAVIISAVMIPFVMTADAVSATASSVWEDGADTIYN